MISDPRELSFERVPGQPGAGAEAALVLRFPSTVGYADPAVDLIARECYPEGDPGRQALFRLRVALAEAVANAIQCGNGADPAKFVQVQVELFSDRIRLAVTDEGPGFDPTAVPDPRDPGLLESPCGRGLFIIRHLAEQVEFNEKGNTIWMTLPRW